MDTSTVAVIFLALVAGGTVGFAVGVKLTMRNLKGERDKLEELASSIHKQVNGIAKDAAQSRESISRLLSRALDKDNGITTRDLKLRPLEEVKE